MLELSNAFNGPEPFGAVISGPRYVGESTRFKAFKIPLLTITYLKYAAFADIVIQHKIFLWKKPCTP
jgi:hypothetical protein